MKPGIHNNIQHFATPVGRTRIASFLISSGLALLVTFAGALQSVAQGDQPVPLLHVKNMDFTPQQPACPNLLATVTESSRPPHPGYWTIDSLDQQSGTLHNAAVSVFVSCISAANGFKHVTVVVGGTSPLTAGWFMTDITARMEQNAANLRMTGNPVPLMLEGGFVGMEADRFALKGHFGGVLLTGSTALDHNGFHVTAKTGTSYVASNSTVALIVSVSPTTDPDRFEVILVGSSSNAATTKAALAAVGHSMKTIVTID